MTTQTMKRFLATATTAALLATGGVAVAGAATNSGSADKPAATTNAAKAGHPRLRVAKLALDTAAKTIGIDRKDLVAAIRKGQTVAAIATAHHVDPQTVEDAVAKALNDKIDAAVAAGKLDADRATKLKARVETLAKKFVEQTPKHPARTARAGHGLATTAAKAIGIEPKDLLAQVRAGKTVAQVAQAHGVDPQTVVDAIVKAGTARLTKAADRFVNHTH